MQDTRNIKFGTDGWRAVIGKDFTFVNVQAVSAACAAYFNRTKKTSRVKILVGFDNRFLSKEFASTIAGVLSAHNIDVDLFKYSIPTPMLSFAILKHKFSGGIMVTASHNPYLYNGIKIKTASGTSAGVETTTNIEKLLQLNTPVRLGGKGRIRAADFSAEYINNLHKFLKKPVFKNVKIKVLVDEMYGSQNSIIVNLLREFGIKASAMHNSVNPCFGGINPEPIANNLKALSSTVKTGRFDLGLATDGDADRIGAMCPDGKTITSHQIIALLCLHLLKNKKITGAIAKTINTTTWLDRIASRNKIKLYETPVGFKHLANLLETKDILIAGEESGGIGFKNYIYERDGILSGLLLTEMLCFEKKSIIKILDELYRDYGYFYYLREDIDISKMKHQKSNMSFNALKNIKRIASKKVVSVTNLDGIKFTLDDDSWLLLRLSGTEPLLRIYAEATSVNLAKKLIKYGKNLLCP